jgi:hypothetical protein
MTYANARILIPSILRWGFNCLWAFEVNIEVMGYRSLSFQNAASLIPSFLPYLLSVSVCQWPFFQSLITVTALLCGQLTYRNNLINRFMET